VVLAESVGGDQVLGDAGVLELRPALLDLGEHLRWMFTTYGAH
jgi:hypothetical protein